MRTKPIMETIIDLLDTVRCDDEHGTGRGSCHCQVNDIINEIVWNLYKLEEEFLHGN